MKENNLTKNTILLSIGTVLNKGIAFFMIPLFSSWLTTEDYGIFDLLCTYVIMLMPILSLAVGNGMFRYAIEASEEEKRVYITTGLIIYLIGTGIFGGIAIIIYNLYNMPIIIPFYIMLIGEMINQYLQFFLRAIKKISVYSFCSVITTICIFVNVLIFVKILNQGLYGIIYGYALGYLIGDAIIVIYTKYISYLRLQWDSNKIKQLIKYSLPLIPNNLSWWVVGASDRTIINVFLGAAANGIYAISYKIPNLCTSVFNSFSIAWQESAIDMNDSSERNKYYNSVYNKMILILISLCAGILSCNFILFDYIFDSKYLQAHLYVPILVTSIIFNSISQFLGGIQISLKKTKENGVTTIIGAIVNVIAHIALIKLVGLYAAAISTLVSNFVIVLLRKVKIKKEVILKLENKNLIYVFIYMYFCITAYFYIKLPYVLNIINVILACIVFILINKQNILKIIKRITKKQ